jgi:putative SOS response-associated peptidase YedK
MCRRFTNPYTWRELLELYVPSVDGQNKDWNPNFNIAPAMQIPVILTEYGTRHAELVRWGLVTAWSKELGTPTRFNARSDGVPFNRMFRGAWEAGRRCIIPASSFFVWRRKDKQPFAIALRNGMPMAFAGLWEESTLIGKRPFRSGTIMTCEANKLIAEFGGRMPVILGEENWPVWLGEQGANEFAIRALLKPFDAAQMTSWPVSKAVAALKSRGAELIEPIAV